MEMRDEVLDREKHMIRALNSADKDGISLKAMSHEPMSI
jgi:hypothetical protein